MAIDPQSQITIIRRHYAEYGQRDTDNQKFQQRHFMISLTDTLINLINRVRTDHNLIPLSLNTKLSDAADLHAAYMLQVSILSHTGRKNSNFGDRINKENYQFIFAAENVAFGASSAADALKLWNRSAPHRANILNPDYREVGAGVAPIISHKGNDKNRYWSLTLASPLVSEPEML